MVIPDMLKNAPMFKRLDARIKVHNVPSSLSNSRLCILVFLIFIFERMQGKGSALGVGRGRAVAMRARVSSVSLINPFSFFFEFALVTFFKCYVYVTLLRLVWD